MNQPTALQLRDWGTLASSIETTELGLGRLTTAQNVMLRPTGAIKGIPRYFRLWATGFAQTMQATMRALPFSGYPSGVGVNGAARTANKCIAVRIYRQGKNFLFFYDLLNDRCRGLYYMGDDGTYTSGAYTWGTGTPGYEVLAVGLNATARWFGRRMGPMLKLSNNVDIPVCVQLDRTVVPGKWRLAGSNQAPSAATISKVPSASSTNVQAYWKIPTAGGVAFFADASTEAIYTYTSIGTLSAVGITADRLTVTGFIPTEGMPIMMSGGVAPGGTTLFTVYYSRNISGTTFQVSSSLAGAIINITSTGSGTRSLYQIFAHGYADGAYVAVAAVTGTLPTGLSAGNYYLRDVSTYAFRVTASPGGSIIAFTTNGTPIITVTPVGVATRAGAASLTFTADAITFPGVSGNNKIKVAIQYTAYATAISSTRTGTGTVSDPYIYTLITGLGASASSNDAIVNYVNSDTLSVGILDASTSAADATADTGTWAATPLLNGAGSGTSDGLTNQTCTVYLRFWDPGSERVGYEGISSDISNEIILTNTETSDILVTIQTNPTVEGGRFGFIRVYFQFGEGATAIWNLVGEVANTSGTKTIQVGTNTVIGQAMSADQNRPLPFKAVVMVQNQVWHGGSTTTPDLLYVSKIAVDDEIAPEGASILDPFLIVLPDQTSDFRVTALDTDDYRLHVHTSQGVILLDPQNPTENRHIPQVPVGAINPACLVKWEKNQIYYLGSDLTVYQFDGARYGKRNASSATKDASLLILDTANLERVSRDPDRVNAWLDTRAELLWYHFPAQSDNLLTGFSYDFQASGVLGPFTYPKVGFMAEMEPELTVRVWSDESGNLFYMDSLDQEDWGDTLTASVPFTSHSTATPMPAQFNGWGFVDYSGSRYYQAYESIIETGFVDLQNPTLYKAWCGFTWTTIKNSRGFVEITFTNKSGRSTTRIYGDMGEKGNQQTHRVLPSMGGEAVKIKMRIISAEQAGWVLRNGTLLYRPAKAY